LDFYGLTMKNVSLLLVLFLVTGCASLPEPNFNPDGPSLRVITYNINWGIPNPQQVVKFLLETDADVVCLQETHSNWEAILKKHLSKSYPYSSFHSAGGAGGIAFLSKLKLSNVKVIEATAGWFPALIADVETEIGCVQFLNVHLKPPLTDSGSVSVSAYYDTLDIHRNELSHFLKVVDRNAPLIIAGDFNENEHREAIRDLLNSGFNDALFLYDRKSKTWAWKVMPGITLRNRYDHIIYSKHFHCTGAKVTDVKASDHMPVLAVFTRAKDWAKQQSSGDVTMRRP
jgi:endonuclease/exonuclease/phosphatase family metal-dependent hydrolase